MNNVQTQWSRRAEDAGVDRRRGVRKVLRVQARVILEGEGSIDARTIDLSHSGVSITSPRQLNVGQECIVELGVSVPEIANPPPLRAGVRYCARLREGEFRIGMQFTSVSIQAAELIVAVLG
jgi:PilZ domain